MKSGFLVVLAGFTFALGGCSSVEEDVAPEPTPGSMSGGNAPVPVDQGAPIAGGALFNGN